MVKRTRVSLVNSEDLTTLRYKHLNSTHDFTGLSLYSNIEFKAWLTDTLNYIAQYLLSLFCTICHDKLKAGNMYGKALADCNTITWVALLVLGQISH